MATVQEIKNKMILAKDNEIDLAELNSKSKTSIWNLILYIVAVSFQDIKTYFDAHRKNVDTALKNEKYGTLAWYRKKALDFQNGFDLITDSDLFDNTDATEEEIEDSKIIKYAAVTEGDNLGTVVIKIATEENSKLKPITNEVEKAVQAYFEEIKIAGTRISVTNSFPDKLFLNMEIQIDPLVLNSNGLHKRDGNNPVEETIIQFLKELPFNGELVLQDLEIRLRKIDGIKIAEIQRAMSSWINPVLGEYGVPNEIDTKRIPESGYFEIVNFNDIKYVV
ncbi:nucleotidyltransferase [Tenacibaculum jejuense]|uniref:Nucleotidyltransferase n=1 Tax=Tenacibaculum jejuense TaxID=584609 RepID=A0A238UBJ4_9FLAO|nr:nucleotidyltransferase [Tenacibaculum jejuense]SNR16539.1 conserved protein of unknown function [Tenacibaculum jejuense]